MLNTNLTTTAFDRHEPIPGYRTAELLGRGGYGEVWRAIAPGGIAKAVKIVYGGEDSSQADTEIKALARVKDVRHPMLLSIERIEVTHGNLVIVTELADGSLKQQYQKYREGQSVGVPQDELLQYVNDTAEALDYLYEKCSLQHLDVKPENILIIGGRAKVGDFGLVKSLYDRSASIVGGLTPTYAPPELFEGKPTRHSDQYSLAIVYVHMLTGVLPFNASNMAQLATLHLRGVPDLAALPKRQRTVIARALSKDPAHRFDSCVAMVKALREAASEPREPEQASPAPEMKASPAPRPKAPAPRPAGTPLLSREIKNAALARRPASENETAAVSAGTESTRSIPPTVLVGIGGTGVEVLAKLVRRLNDRFGRAEQWPPVEIVVIDANARTLTSHFQEDDLARVHPVPAPLRSADSYGSQSGDFVRWLGRRWFYNIPRDLTSTGYRPLGRLALLSNAPRVRSAIGTVIERTAERIAASAKRNDPAQPAGAVTPRVIVIGAISGGMAGGSMLDVAYALRGELKRRGLPDDVVQGILLHATPRSAADRDRARANAYSTLSELHHFSRPGSHYPGEPSLGTPPFHGDNATFSRAHLLRLGESLGPVEEDLITDQLAEFVYGTTFTPAHRVLDELGIEESRRADAAQLVAPLQCYDILSLGAGTSQIVAGAVQTACNDVITLWRDGRQPEAPSDSTVGERTVKMNSFASYAAPRSKKVEEAVKRQLAESQLDFTHFEQIAGEVLNLETGGDSANLVSRLVDEALTATQADYEGAARTEAALSMIDQYLQCDTAIGVDESECLQLYARMMERLGAQTRGRAAPFLDWIRGLIEVSDVRIEGARLNATTAQKLLQTIQEGATVQAGELHEKSLAIALDVRGVDGPKAEKSRFSGWSLRKKDPDEKLREALKIFTETRVQEVLRRAVAKIVRIIDAELSTVIEQLDRLARELSLLAEPPRKMEEPVQEEDDESDSPAAIALAGYRQMMLAQLGLRRQIIARKIEESMERRVFHGDRGLRRFLEPEAEMRKSLWRPLTESARQAVLDCIREIQCQLVDGTLDKEGRGGATSLAVLLRSGMHDDDGQVVRRVLIVPEEVNPAGLRQRLDTILPDAQVVRGRQCDVTLWNIRRPTPIATAADDLIAGHEVYKDLAEKLHARIDIAWRAFTEADAQAPASSDEPVPSAFPTRTAMLPAGR